MIRTADFLKTIDIFNKLMYNIDIVKIRQSEVNTMVNEKYYEGHEGDEEILFRLYIGKKS